MNLYEKYEQWDTNNRVSKAENLHELASLVRGGKALFGLGRRAIDAIADFISPTNPIDIDTDPEIDVIVDILNDPNNANLDDASLLDLLDRASPRPDGPNPYGEKPAGFVGPETPTRPGAVGPGDPFVDDWVDDIIDNDNFPDDGSAVIGSLPGGGAGTPGSNLMGPPDPNNPMDIRNYMDDDDTP